MIYPTKEIHSFAEKETHVHLVWKNQDLQVFNNAPFLVRDKILQIIISHLSNSS